MQNKKDRTFRPAFSKTLNLIRAASGKHARQCHGNRHFFACPHDDHFDRIAGRMLPQHMGDVRVGIDLITVDRQNPVIGLQARGFRAAADGAGRNHALRGRAVAVAKLAFNQRFRRLCKILPRFFRESVGRKRTPRPAKRSLCVKLSLASKLMD